MATGETWKNVVAAIAAEGGPTRSPSMRRLYELAREDGFPILRKSGHPESEMEDLIQEALFSCLAKLPHIETPRAYFLTSLTNARITRLRALQRGGQVVSTDDPSAHPEALSGGADQRAGAAERLAYAQLIDRALGVLTPRDAEILLAVAKGAERDELAKRYKVSRDGIDQVVSRARAKLGRYAAFVDRGGEPKSEREDETRGTPPADGEAIKSPTSPTAGRRR